jgi:hypothetical protein
VKSLCDAAAELVLSVDPIEAEIEEKNRQLCFAAFGDQWTQVKSQ